VQHRPAVLLERPRLNPSLVRAPDLLPPPPLSSITEALKKAAKESGKPCPASALRREPKGPRDGFQLNLGNTFEKKVHLLKPEPYVFRPLEKAYLVK
jgi:hypothetical protein